MKGKIIITCLVILSLLLSVSYVKNDLSFQQINNIRIGNGLIKDKQLENNFLLSEPIYICGDENLTAQATFNGWAGNGTEDNPYIIENLSINTSIMSINSVHIIDTTLHLEIKNNLIINSLNNNILLRNVTNILLINNIIENSKCINLQILYSSKIKISQNFISKSEFFGIFLDGTNDIVIENNNINNNSQFGIHIDDKSFNTSIYLNIFIDNNNGSIQAYSGSNNYWSNGTHGNYWSDYSGIDSNGDGIGDTAYLIAGDGLESDPYPLMHPLNYVETKESSSFLLLSVILGLFSYTIFFKKRRNKFGEH